MRAELIVDSSVVAKFFFFEEGSERAQDLLTSGVVVAAPELLLIEMASVATKRVRRGLTSVERALDAMASVGDLIDEFAPLRALGPTAFRLANDSGCSAYDATYLAVARDRGVPLVTADLRLIAHAAAAGMKRLVRAL
ncbi:MAG: type II toxin-antitoxin system VapC family toxin [Caulobacteraceae bacterium]|nr:type II toxin-antitoxin system VapC family toxin [Caulobacteraceae bacterium]